MTAMAGILMALVGLGIVIGASVAFVYPLPGLTTNRGRGWTVVVGYGVLCWGSIIIRQTVPEELREPFAGPIMLVSFGAFILSCIALIRPSPNLWLPTRKRAGYVCALSFGLMAVAAQLAPEPPPPTPEELAAQAAEAKREARERAAQELEDRKEAIRDWGADYQSAAAVRCEDHIEQRAQYDFEWTQGWGGRIFAGWTAEDPANPSEEYPAITESTLLVYVGDKIRFQNRFGAFRNYKYACYYHPESKTVIRVIASPGRLNQYQ